jgi:ubiquinone biosynthesis protein
MTEGLGLAAQLALLAPTLLVITFAATRLLGVRRSWLAGVASAVLAMVVAVAVSLTLAEGHVTAPGFFRNTLALAFALTMVTAVGADLLARPGALAPRRPSGALLPVVPHPLAWLRSAVEDARRTREIVAILSRNGFGPALGLRHRRRRREAVQRAPTGERVRALLEQCGGMFVKIGQMASTRTDAFPPDAIAALSRLQSRVTPESPETMRPLLEAELGATVEEVFAEFDWSPVAAASIAQVYRARLRTGEPVIVKAQRPGVAGIVRRDSKVLLRLASMVEHNAPAGHEQRAVELARSFTAGLADELDFRTEARHTETIRANMAVVPGVRVPEVHSRLSTDRVLVQERLEGVTAADLARAAESGEPARVAESGEPARAAESGPAERERLADVLLRSALTQMMVDGVFHADLHPGNVMVLDDGSVGLVDFGHVGRLDPLLQASLRQMLLATGRRDAARLREAVSEIAEIRDELDPDALERALSRFMAAHVGGGALGAAAIHDLLQLLSRFGIVVPVELTTFSRALMVLEGTLGVLVPGYDLGAHARELAEEWAVEPPGGSTLADMARAELLALVPALRRLPRRIDRVGDLLERGRLTTRVSLFASAADAAFVTRLVNRATLGFLGAVLGLISAVLLGTERGPVLADGTQLLHVLGVVGLASGAVLMLRVVAAIVRDGLN